MATIGSVTKRPDGRYEGELRTLSIRAEIAILPVGDKSSPNQPDFRVLSQGIEIGAGWLRTGQTSGKEYVALSIAAPEFGARTLVRQPRACCRSERRERLRSDLESAGLSAPRSGPRACGRGGLSRASSSGGSATRNAHPPAQR